MNKTIFRLVPGIVALLAATQPVQAEPAALPPFQDAVAEFARLAAQPADGRCGGQPALVLPVAADDRLQVRYEAENGHLRILYRMGFNQVTEGWNWHPEADAGREDYYRFKYLPLQSTREQRGGYRFADKLDEPQDVRVEWRHDYFFAFDNLYDFYPRRVDDDAGFAATIAVPAADAERLAQGGLRLALVGHLGDPCISESTTFWKAVHSRPVDFTLKKHYLVGRLDEVWFYDAGSGRLLARLGAGGK